MTEETKAKPLYGVVYRDKDSRTGKVYYAIDDCIRHDSLSSALHEADSLIRDDHYDVTAIVKITPEHGEVTTVYCGARVQNEIYELLAEEEELERISRQDEQELRRDYYNNLI